MLGRSHFNTGYAKQCLAFGRTGKASLSYHRYRYTNVTGGNTTASMQQANHSLLRTVGQGVRQTGRVIKHGVVKTGKAFKKAAGKTGKWIKKHKTGIALSALTTAGIGGVSGDVQALADHNAAQHDKELLSGARSLSGNTIAPYYGGSFFGSGSGGGTMYSSTPTVIHKRKRHLPKKNKKTLAKRRRASKCRSSTSRRHITKQSTSSKKYRPSHKRNQKRRTSRNKGKAF